MVVAKPFPEKQMHAMKRAVRKMKRPPAFVRGRWFVSPLNFDSNVLSRMKLPKSVTISDVSVREGQQTAGSYILSATDQVRMARALDELGVQMIQVGINISSPSVQHEIKRITQLGLKAEVITCVTSREEVDIAADCGVDIIEFFTGPIPSLQVLFGDTARSESDQIKRGIQVVKYAKSLGLKTRADINYSALTTPEFAVRFFESLANEGADYLHLADSTGMTGTPAFRYLVSTIKNKIPDVPLGVHCHNDFGQGTANALAAVEEGAEIIDVVVGGMGERAGLAGLAETVLALEAIYGINTGLRLKKLHKIHELYSSATHYPVPKNKPLIGDNALSNTIELHAIDEFVDSWLATPINPQIVGGRKRYYFGKFSGIYSLFLKMRELGLPVDWSNLGDIYERAVTLLEKKRLLNDGDIKHLIVK